MRPATGLRASGASFHDNVIVTNHPSRTDPEFHPRVFMSYSSAPGHDDWVRRLSTRLRGNGVDVILDQWEVRLGSDLPHFMEQGLTGADRVIAVCSDSYIAKANSGKRGVGYEKKIATADLMRDAVTSHIVPVLRDTTVVPPTPTFLLGARYVDFRDDEQWDASYQELLYDLYGQEILPKPALGANPFAGNNSIIAAQAIGYDPTAFASPALAGVVTYPYDDNDGRFVIGTGIAAFTIDLGSASADSVHVYRDPTDIYSVALAADTPLEQVQSPEQYDSSSRSRTARVGDSVVLINTAGRVAVFEVLSVTVRDTSADGIPRVTLKYSIVK